METPVRAALSAALALVLAGCSEVVDPGWELRVETSQAVYTLPDDPIIVAVTVPFTVRNVGVRPVALDRCGGLAAELQRREAGAWVDIASLTCLPGPNQEPPVLAPGRTASGQASVSEVGEYRLLIPVAVEAGAAFRSRAVSPSFFARSLKD
jgi:hypothetical protein